MAESNDDLPQPTCPTTATRREDGTEMLMLQLTTPLSTQHSREQTKHTNNKTITYLPTLTQNHNKYTVT